MSDVCNLAGGAEDPCACVPMVQFAEIQVEYSAPSSAESGEQQSTAAIVSTLRAKKRLEGMQQLAAQRNSERKREQVDQTSSARQLMSKKGMARSGWSSSSGEKKWNDTVALYRKHEAKKRFIIDPRTSSAIAWWDLVTAMALCFTALVTPYEVAFLPSATLPDGPWPLFAINRVIDLVFLIDLILQFFIAFPDQERRGAQQRGGAVKYVFKKRKIAVHYLKTWFLVDVLSVGVSAIDFVVLTPPNSADSAEGTADLEGDGENRAVRMLRVPMRLLRVLRLFKLLRLLRASRLLRRWETRMSINYGLLTMLRCVAHVLLCVHWMACAWTLQSELFAPSPLDSWMGAYGYCKPVAEAAAATPTTPGGGGGGGGGSGGGGGLAASSCVPHGELYVASLYWATLVTTGLGGGDIESSMLSSAERIAGVVLTLLGSLVWANVVATLCGVINLQFNDVIAFRRTLDDLNMMMAQYNFPAEERRKLREYFHQSQHLNRAASYQRLTSRMSPKLQGEVAMMCNGALLQLVGCFALLEDDFVARVANTMRACVFPPMEQVTPGYFYLVHSGIALYGGAVFNRGGHWGEDVLFLTQRLKRYRGVAMTYLQVFRLAHDDLFALTETDPLAKRLLRRQALLLMLRRYLLDVAERERSRADAAAVKAAATAGGAANDANGGAATARRASALSASPLRRSLLRSRTLNDSEISEAAALTAQASEESEEAGAEEEEAAVVLGRPSRWGLTTVHVETVGVSNGESLTMEGSGPANGRGSPQPRHSCTMSSSAGAAPPLLARGSSGASSSGGGGRDGAWERKMERRQADLATEMAALRADVRELCQMARMSRSMFS